MMLDQGDWNNLSEEGLLNLLERDSLPRHVAFIMDGNGRWAKQRGLSRIAGHHEGVHSVREVITSCCELGISALTLYAFSLENWKRPQEEIALLMDLFVEYFQGECERCLRENIRFRTIGRRELLPKRIQVMIRELENSSRDHDQLTVTLALSYGGRAEIVDAVKKIMGDATKGIISDQQLTEQMFSCYLDTVDLPDPDLLIRTSGEVRVSNFLLWQIAYAELYFTKTFWPDFRRREFLMALLDYQRRERRLGGLGPSPKSGLEVSASSNEPGLSKIVAGGESLRPTYHVPKTMIGLPTPSLHFSAPNWLD